MSLIHFIKLRERDKTQNDLCAQQRFRSAWASAQSGQSSLYAQWVAKNPKFLHAVSEYSCFFWIFAGRTSHLLVLSCCGSNWCEWERFAFRCLGDACGVNWYKTHIALIHFSKMRGCIYYTHPPVYPINANSTVCEPEHDKTNKMICVPREDSEQSEHPPSLIRVFAVHIILSYPLSVQQRLWSDWVDAQAAKADLRRAHRSFCWFCQ